MLMNLFAELFYAMPLLLYVLPDLLFITFEGRLSIAFYFVSLLYCVTLAYDMIGALDLSLIWYLHSTWLSPLYFRNYLLEAIDYTLHLFSPETQPLEETRSSTFPSSFNPVTIALGCWATSMFLLLCLDVFLFFDNDEQLFQNTTHRSAPTQDSYEWQGEWEDMGRFLEQLAPPVLWKFTPEQLQNPKKLAECLKKGCCCPGFSRQTQIAATCWGLAYAYRGALTAIQYPPREEVVSGSDNKTTDTPTTSTVANPAPMAGAAANPAPMAGAAANPAPGAAAANPAPMAGAAANSAPMAGAAANPAPMAGAAANPAPGASAANPAPAANAVAKAERQISVVSLIPRVREKQQQEESAQLVRNEAASPKQEQEKGSEEKSCSKAEQWEEQKGDETEVSESENTQYLSLRDLQYIREDFRHFPGEHIVTWLLRCWDSGAGRYRLTGKEAQQLGFLTRHWGIDRMIRKGEQASTLWRRLLSAVKERYPFKEDLVCQLGKWTTMERGIQYLRELAVLEVVYSDLDNGQLPVDPDKVQCTRAMWLNFVRSAPPFHAKALALMNWKSREAPVVDTLVWKLQQYQENLSFSFSGQSMSY
ncbi:uncharacterized protein [Anas platyrhynchos]|uniref:uncharacterized protein isoform X1 n=1 Tax=Anas platyrhynchos TaxID=8839 RepID=UPI003AF26DAA